MAGALETKDAESKKEVLEGGRKGSGSLIEFPTSEGGLAAAREAHGGMSGKPNVALPEIVITKEKNDSAKEKSQGSSSGELEKEKSLSKSPSEFNPALKEIPKIGKEVAPNFQTQGQTPPHKILPNLSIENTTSLKH